MEGLIRDHFAQASDRGHTAPMIAEAATPPAPPVKLASLVLSRRGDSGPARPFGRRSRSRKATRISAEDVDERSPPSPRQSRVAAPPPRRSPPPPRPPPNPSPRSPPPGRRDAALRRTPSSPRPRQLGWVKGPDRRRRSRRRATSPSPPRSRPRQGGHDDRRRDFARVRPITAVGLSRSASRTTPPRPTICSPARAPRTMRTLAQARPFTEKVAKGGRRPRPRPLRRPRLRQSAETACRSLKKSGFACFAARD